MRNESNDYRKKEERNNTGFHLFFRRMEDLKDALALVERDTDRTVLPAADVV